MEKDRKQMIRERVRFLIDSFEHGNQAAFAKKLDTLRGLVSDWFSDKKDTAPGPKYREKICKVYGVSDRWLLGLEPLQEIDKLQENVVKKQENLEHKEPTQEGFGPLPLSHNERDQELHDKLIEATTEARIYKGIVDTYFGRLETVVVALQELTKDFIKEKNASSQNAQDQDTQAADTRAQTQVRSAPPTRRPHGQV